MKAYRMIPALLLLLALCACGNASAPAEANPETTQTSLEETANLTGSYEVYVTGYDWGAAVDKAVVHLDAPLDSVGKEDFTVTETKAATDFTQEGYPVAEQTFDREIVDAYLLDADGNRTSAPSDTVALELYASPNDGSPINYEPTAGLNTWCDPDYLTIVKAGDANLTSNGAEVDSLTIDTNASERITSVDDIALDSYTSAGGVTYPYAHYEPEGGSKTLVVWLHGGGEGGTENTSPQITMLANEAVNLMREDFQSKVGGANILIPQCPTLWMDMTGDAVVGSVWELNEGTSFYTESLKELIDAYKEVTGSEKVILTGCSNGGFMSLLMALTYPEEFDGIVPVCEAMKDEYISDERLSAIKDLPMYFVYSEDDDTVVPEIFEAPTIQRLRDMDAANLHVSTTEHVYDTSGLYMDESGNPYQYAGHFSWVYFHNDETACNEHGETAWDFIADTVRN